MKVVNGRDYLTPDKRAVIVKMAKKWVNSQKHMQNGKPLCERYIDSLISIAEYKPGYGYAEGIEDDKGYLHCLLVGEMVENMWVQQIDANITCILTNRPNNPKYLPILVDRFFKWAQRRSAEEIYIYSWSFRPAYKKLFDRLGFEPAGYSYKRNCK